ncbi:MAG: class I SAM-dependent methyltransferase, partial [Planctomycetota bacterium]
MNSQSNRSQENYFKQLLPVPDTEDLELHRENCSPELITKRLRELVPLLEFCGFRVESVTPEETVVSVPLLHSAVNQNGTQQASVFYLLADYALGVAMFGVLPGVYVTGVHDRGRALPVQYWLKRGTVKHLSPGSGTMRAVVKISPEKSAELRQSLIDNGRGEVKERVSIYQGEQLVAATEHTMGLYADVPRRAGAKINPFQMLSLKVSALMIAGLRGDGLSSAVAGEQGNAIAKRMSVATPQLPTLVKGRSVSIKRHLLAEGQRHEQVVCLGVGLDPKPIEHATAGQHWFGVDLPEMIGERDAAFARAGASSSHYTAVAADLRVAGWVDRLVESGFDPGKPTTVICEGLAMYLTTSEFVSLCGQVKCLMRHPESRLWLDHVTEDLFTMEQP